MTRHRTLLGHAINGTGVPVHIEPIGAGRVDIRPALHRANVLAGQLTDPARSRRRHLIAVAALVGIAALVWIAIARWT